jgi:hypothetical protein
VQDIDSNLVAANGNHAAARRAASPRAPVPPALAGNEVLIPT